MHGAEAAKPGRSDVQDIDGVDRQQSRGAAKKDGKQIKRYGAQYQLPLEDESEPGQQIFQIDGILADDLRVGLDEKSGDHGY